MEINKFKILFLSFILAIASISEGAALDNYFHKVDKEPGFQFEIPQFEHWEIKRQSDTVITFNPDETIAVDFETPPNIGILIDRKLEKDQVKETSQLQKTANGISYQPVFVSGFAKKGLKFTKDKHEIIILMVDHMPQYGLDAQLVEKTLLQTFKYNGEISASTEPREVEMVKRDNIFSGLFNRSALRALSEKIRGRTISTAEVKDYIAKRGELKLFTSYDAVQNFFVGSNSLPLLNYFIKGEKPVQADRLQSLELLLKNGANPNAQSEETMSFDSLAPVLYASLMGDTEALALMLKHGANINLVEEKFMGTFGPAVVLAQNDQSADLILKSGLDKTTKNKDGLTLAQQLIFARLSSEAILNRLKWMKSNGFDIQGTSSSATYQPLSHAKNQIDAWKDKNADNVRYWTEIVKILEQGK